MSGASAQRVQTLLNEHFPQVRFHIETLDETRARVRKPVEREHLRPGGTVSGPTMMALADASVYIALLGRLGMVLDAVTSSLTIHFLRRPATQELVAEARIIKVGRQLAVGDAWLYAGDDPSAVAQATVTYSLPRTASHENGCG